MAEAMMVVQVEATVMVARAAEMAEVRAVSRVVGRVVARVVAMAEVTAVATFDPPERRSERVRTSAERVRERARHRV
jgi:hypothetical protein